MKLGKWKLLLPLALLAVGATIGTSGALAKSAQSSDVKVAIMTDCKGAFAFGYEVDTAGTIAAFSQYAGAKPKNKKKPSAGMTGGSAGGKKLNIVGIGCGDETPALALKETTSAHGAARRRGHDRPAVRRRGGLDRQLGEAEPARRR